MITNKHINKIITAIIAVAVILTLGMIVNYDRIESVSTNKGITLEYESALFDTSSPMKVDIIMDDEDWQDMLDNATSEKYYQCDVEINGKTYYRVGIRPKGNTSLSSIAREPDNNRYSLKLEFDQYVDGQTCYGLDKLILNNNYADATNMKEAMIYDMFQYIGADASLYNYAKISVNGEYWGVYLALEAVEDSFMLRNYGVESGDLYKPDNMNFGNEENRPDGKGRPDMKEAFAGKDRPDMKEAFAGSRKPGGREGISDGADLNYTDDKLDSYSAIWEGEVAKTSDSDHTRVVTALKNISDGTNLEKYMDVDNLLKYAAVHVFSVNADSLSGNMSHNYYLYETNGQLNILPWDYNLSLGGMGNKENGSATETVNSAINNAFNGTRFFDMLLTDETYHAQYNDYIQKLVDEYLLGDGFINFYNRTRSQIDELVKTDPNALYTYEEYEKALETLCEVVKLRGESIDGQLNGTIPSTKRGQQNSETLIDASYLDLSVMGTMDMGSNRGPESFAIKGEN